MKSGYFWWGPPRLLFLSAGERRGGSRASRGPDLLLCNLPPISSCFGSSVSTGFTDNTSGPLYLASITFRQLFGSFYLFNVSKTDSDTSWIIFKCDWTL